MYYKINKTIAESLGEFTYNGINFSPFVREQTDGTYLVSEDIQELLKDTEQFKQINWDELEKISTFDDKLPNNFNL